MLSVQEAPAFKGLLTQILQDYNLYSEAQN